MVNSSSLRRVTVVLSAILAIAACTGRPPAAPQPLATAPAPTTVAATVETAPASAPLSDGGSAPADAATPAAETTADVAPLPAATLAANTIEPAPTATSRPTASPMPLATTTSAPTPSPAPTATQVPSSTASNSAVALLAPVATPTHTLSTAPNPLQIEIMRQQSYPGSEITFEQKLDPGANYSRYIVSYKSDGLKIYALMTIPNGTRPPTGWPVIVFNHGYIPPAQYRTTERYVAYVDAIARAGYIVFKSDYRGHGNSEGSADGGGYGTPNFTRDVLNAVASLKAYPDADPQRIGMWGHSMGGQVTLRAMVVSKDIKAGVIWGGVVGSYPDLVSHWTRRPSAEYIPMSSRRWRQDLINQYGTPQQNPAFWASISPNSYLQDISGPLQLHHSGSDPEVPVAFSQTLDAELQAAGKTVELYTYPGDNHNINGNFNTAMARTIAWLDKYVKGS